VDEKATFGRGESVEDPGEGASDGVDNAEEGASDDVDDAGEGASDDVDDAGEEKVRTSVTGLGLKRARSPFLVGLVYMSQELCWSVGIKGKALYVGDVFMRLLKNDLPFSRRKPGAHYPLGRVKLQLSGPVVSQLLQCWNCTSTGHVQPSSMIKGICFSCKNFSIASAVRVSYAWTLLIYFIINASILTRTYHASD
jgi:hypothetical protein